MNEPSFWITFWTVAFAVGVGAYYLVALVVIPLGVSDIKRLFNTLDTRDETPNQENDP